MAISLLNFSPRQVGGPNPPADIKLLADKVDELLTQFNSGNTGGGGTTPTPNITPPQPTSGVVNDVANTFDWTNPSGYGIADLEYTMNTGGTYQQVTQKPIPIGNIALGAGKVGVRVKAATGRNISDTLYNQTAYTVGVVENTNIEVFSNFSFDQAAGSRNGNWEKFGAGSELTGNGIYKPTATDDSAVIIQQVPVEPGVDYEIIAQFTAGFGTGARLELVPVGSGITWKNNDVLGQAGTNWVTSGFKRICSFDSNSVQCFFFARGPVPFSVEYISLKKV